MLVGFEEIKNYKFGKVENKKRSKNEKTLKKLAF